MKLEKAKETLEEIKNVSIKNDEKAIHVGITPKYTRWINAIETFLQELENSISKDEVREEIKELSKKLCEPNNDRWEKDDNNYFNKIKAQIKILQELLEDK